LVLPESPPVVAVTLNVVVALTLCTICVADVPGGVAAVPAPVQAHVVVPSTLDEQDAVRVTFVGPVIDDGLAVNEQPDGAPAAGGVAGLHVNVVPLKDQLQRFDGSEIVKPPAYAGATSAGAAIRAAAASTRPT
jgi:hypothetical protein